MSSKKVDHINLDTQGFNIKKEIGKRIRDIRGELSQKEFANLIGIHKDQLSRYERGATLPRPELLKRIAEHGEISTGSLFEMGQFKVSESEAKYQILPACAKKLLKNVTEILESGNDVMIDLLKANIKALLEAVRASKSRE
jgi:transcriptional regulator with XRE-family HTH domain